ncbi:3-oxo-5-alpha-steroid 4-dehydrogenase 2b isoform X2 [Phyllopteryx taeniolatus]|uniref:3-oxo-5-alpha-steroid 4-dehydrogenase 2b isoform X2 n=1 Tax=Phyllopteryx taeniolatus TaxID=161469 RepID=UPI002AD5AB60|nr:3-oxo-5-alpha-steroid 4-dehydrogenase 2b isoform X2 [Phyllopteryx taeniolatus]
MHGRLIEDSQLPIGVNVSANGCLFKCALQLASNQFRVYPAYCPQIGSSKPVTLVRISGTENGWMDGFKIYIFHRGWFNIFEDFSRVKERKQTHKMHCNEDFLNYLSFGMIMAGLWHLYHHRKTQTSYGRHMVHDRHTSVGKRLLLGTFCLHYFHRTFIHSFLIRGNPYPLSVMVGAVIICSVNGFLQGHYLLHCAQLDEWKTDCRLKIGLLLFYTGMAINIYSDYHLRNLRKKGELIYKVPTGGLFEYVSAPNYFGEIFEWFGYAMATWSLPSLSFAVFTTCFIGPRAVYHHRFYKEKFKDYPKSRKAVIPFLL